MENIEIWDEVWGGQEDDKEFRWWLKREANGVRGKKIISYIEQYAGNINGLKIVEAGAGSGVYSMMFAKRGADVTLKIFYACRPEIFPAFLTIYSARIFS